MFSISAPFVRRPVATVLLAIGMCLAGLVAWQQLPVSAMPRVDLPTIFVSVSQPGANPETMAATVIAPLERQIGAVAGITEMTSNSSNGSGNIIIQFDLSRTQESAARDVQAAVNAARSDLPSSLPNPPSIRKVNPADFPVMILALTSDTLRQTELYDVADSIVAQRLAQVTGVAQVSVGGADQPAVRVAVNPDAITAAGLSMDDVRNAIANSNVTQAIGTIDGATQSASIGVNDRLRRAEQFGAVIVKANADGGVMRLHSIARVTDGSRNRRQTGWFNNKPSILLQVYKQADANVIEVVDGVRAALPQLQRWVPGGVHIDVQSDRSGTIRASVHEVELTLLISIGLVIGVVAVFLRRVSPILAASAAVPLSLLGTLVVMWFLGYSLNNFSLMALTISVGFVVDDAIVMIENVARLRERGLTPFEAAIQGSREIGFTIVSITASLIAVFVPLLFMGGVVGRLFQEFSTTLAVAVLISGVLSLTLTPMMTAHLGRHRPEKPPGRFARGFEASLDWVVDLYLRSLRVVLRFPRSMLLLTLGFVVLTVWLYTVVPKSFFPEQDTGLMQGYSQAAPDTSFETMLRLQNQVSAIVAADPAVQSLGATVGSGFNASTNSGQLFITLKPRAERGVSADEVIARLRVPLGRIPGVSVYLRSQQDLFTGGRGGNAQYSYVLLGTDLDELRRWTNTMVEKLRTVPGIFDVSSDQERSGLIERLIIDRDAAARLGVGIDDISAAFNNAFAQRQVSTIYTSRNQYRVVLEIDPALQQSAAQFDRVFVPGRDGPVPLRTVARVERDVAPSRVTHQGQYPAATITFNLGESVALGDAQALVQQAEREVLLPGSIRSQYGGNAAAFQAFSSSMPLLILGALAAIYIVLGVLYESFIHPLTILSSLPTAGLGALLALLVTGIPFSVIALIAVILLMGIVKKNAIMLVDFALEHERKEGATSEESIMLACRDRFRPILMTTLAALFGAVPLAVGTGVGAELREPLGVAIIGGLIVSQLLTLYTTPVIYLALDRLRHRWVRRVVPAPAE